MIVKEIATSVRESFGKGPMGRMRAEGKTPGVVYSGGKEALALEFETKVLFQELLDLQGRNAVITLKIDNGTEKKVLVKEVQTDPLRDTLYHADFLEIDLDKSADFTVSITYTGTAKGVELGGILQIETSSIVLEGKPLDMPDSCTIDVSDLAIGEKVCIKDIAIPEGVALASDPEMVCVSVNTP